MAEDIEYLQENVGADYKYMMLRVPDYKGTRDGGESLVSYLRLGATPQASDPTVEEGADLFDKARPTDGSAPLFINDTRQRTGEPDGIPQATRQATSSRIVSDCGWRDHSDGNRISTTRGDKVEVIRGNYKLLVLGHQDDPEQAAYFDASGGLIQSGDIAPGAISSVRWVQDDDLGGTWAVLEEAEKGHVTNIYHGRMREEFYGPAITTVIGSADQGQLVLEARHVLGAGELGVQHLEDDGGSVRNARRAVDGIATGLPMERLSQPISRQLLHHRVFDPRSSSQASERTKRSASATPASDSSVFVACSIRWRSHNRQEGHLAM